MTSSFFQLGYNPTHSPILDVSRNLGIALRGFDRLGNNLAEFGAGLAKTDQDNADRILAERMNQYKTEADLMNAIQRGDLYKDISGRVSAKVSQQALQDRFKMLEKDEERRKYENNLQFDQLGDYRSKIFAAAQMGNAALAGKLLQEAAIKKGATGSVVDMLKEDANPSRNALTAAGHLGLARKRYEDNKRDLEQLEDLKRVYIDHASNAGGQYDYQTSRDFTIAHGKKLGYSPFVQNAFDNWAANKTGEGQNYWGDTRVLTDKLGSINEKSPEEKLMNSPNRLPFYDDNGYIINQEPENVEESLRDLNSRNTAALNVYSTNFGSINPQKLDTSVQHYQNMSDNDAIDDFMKKNHIPSEDFREVKEALSEIEAEGLSIPQLLALVDNGGNIEVGTTRGFLGSKYNIKFKKDVADNLREINKNPAKRQAFFDQTGNINKLISRTNEAIILQKQRNEAHQKFIEAEEKKNKRNTERNKEIYRNAKQRYENLNRQLRRALTDANIVNDPVEANKAVRNTQRATDQLNQNSFDVDYFLGLKDTPTKFSRGD